MTDEIIKAVPEHIPFIATTIREADMDECWKIGAITANDALQASLLSADYARTWIVNGYPAAMGGIRRLNDSEGSVWLLGSDIIDHYPRRFLVRSMLELEKAQKYFDCLFNYIPVEQAKYINWLNWMGFYFYAPEPYGPFRHLCHRFEWRKQ